jgi:hypothetical protein
VRAGQHRHRLARQRRQPQPANQGRGREVAGEQLHGVLGADLVVSVGDDQQGGRGTEAAGQEPEQVQGGLVGPVDVLDHQHGRHPGVPQPFEQGAKQHLPRRLVPEQLVEPTANCGGDVGQRPQRPWGGQRVTGAPQDPGSLPVPEGELVDQRRLADAGLTPDQDQSPASGPSLREPTAEVLERRFSLEEWHAPVIVAVSL